MEENGDERALSSERRLLAATFVGTTALALGEVLVARALLKGPLSTEGLARAVFARAPVGAELALVAALAAPGLWSAFGRRPSRADSAQLVDRVLAVAVLAAGGLSTWRMSTAGTRRVFDAWERSYTTTFLGIPWAATAALVLSALLALAAGRALAAWLVARGAAKSGRLTAQTWMVAVVLFVLPAAATIYVTTGTRILPGFEADDAWAPAFADAACPPAGESGSAASARPAPAAPVPSGIGSGKP